MSLRSLVVVVFACVPAVIDAFCGWGPRLSIPSLRLASKLHLCGNFPCSRRIRAVSMQAAASNGKEDEDEEEIPSLADQKKAVDKTGIMDMARLGEYALMLKGVKSALREAIKLSGGAVDKVVTEIVADLEMVSPVATPTLDPKLMQGDYKCMNCEGGKAGWGKPCNGSALESCGWVGGSGDADVNVTPKSARFLLDQDEFTGKLLVDLPDDSKAVLTWGGGLTLEAPNILVVGCESGEDRLEIRYIDQDLMILRGQKGRLLILQKSLD